jgi:CDP-diacylglycerol--glycerol-3-phosphate 3-phosphatidyltransferase/cardiolipin synthase
MDRICLRDAVSPPGLLSLVRAPLAVAFPFFVSRPPVAVLILALSATSDLLDGWTARRSGRVTETGTILDPVMDKLFVTTVAVTLVLAGRLPLRALILLSARDVLELPLAAWLTFDSRAFESHFGRVKVNPFGKLSTAFQFGTVVSALVAPPLSEPLAVVAGILGTVAGAMYWVRVLGGRGDDGPRGDRARSARRGNVPEAARKPF